MAENSKIEWTDHSWSPWEGCEKVSAGCKFCYAEQRDKQYHGGAHWGTDGIRKMMSESYWQKPLAWNRKAAAEGRRLRIFPSLCDPFEDRPELEAPRRRLLKLIQKTPNLDWLLLTKRPENIHRLTHKAIDPADDPDCKYNIAGEPNGLDVAEFGELYPNIWLGTTVENQEMADKRIPELLKIPARVRFLSCEPLLGPVDLIESFPALGCSNYIESDNKGQIIADGRRLADIHWVIVGGESGPNARPMRTEWARKIIQQCETAKIPVFFKQWGEYSHYDQIGQWISSGKSIISRAVFFRMPEWFHDKLPGVWVTPDGKTYKQINNDEADFYYRVGKKAAGRLLDGQEWSQFPKEGQ